MACNVVRMKTFGTFLERVGNRIKSMRKRSGLTQETVSEGVGMPYRRYQSIEAGKANLTLKSIFRIARYFRREPKTLL
jgi:transcriptional regulator with XRE-family HTH domain